MIKTVSIEEIRKLMDSKQDCQIIDVRETAEHESIRIPGAKLVPLSEIDQKFNLIDKKRSTYLHCGVGKRAQKAAEYLSTLGFKELHVVDGGIKAWIEAGYPVEQGKRENHK